KEVIPPPTADYTPFATKLKDANPNWIFSWAPWVTEVKTFEALRRLGWQGDYITWAHIEAEGELARIKDPQFYVIGANSLFQDNLAIHRQIVDEAKKGNVRYPAEQLTEGWIGGMVLEGVLKNAGWPADAAKIRAAMENVKVDTQGLRGGPIEWSKDNHFRTRQYYRVSHWDPAKSAIAVAKDWVPYDVKCPARRTGHAGARVRRGTPGSKIPSLSKWIPGSRASPAPGMTARASVRAAHRQYHRAVGDLCAARLRLRADLSREPGVEHGARRDRHARRLYAVHQRLAVRRQPAHGDRRGGGDEPHHRRPRLRPSDAQDDRRDGAGSHPHDHRDRHSAARPDRVDLVGRAAAPA